MPIASFGVVLGHIFVYRHLFAEPTHSHDVLAETGHSYFGVATILASAVAVLSLAAYGWISYRDKLRKSNDSGVSFWRNFAVLFVLQALIFVCMELIERASAHGSVDIAAFFASGVFTLGVVFQLATAAFVALLVTGVAKAGELIASLFKQNYVQPSFIFPNATQNHSYLYLRSHCIRGPPLTPLAAAI